MKVGRFGLGFKSVFHMTGRESSFNLQFILDTFSFSSSLFLIIELLKFSMENMKQSWQRTLQGKVTDFLRAFSRFSTLP